MKSWLTGSSLLSLGAIVALSCGTADAPTDDGDGGDPGVVDTTPRRPVVEQLVRASMALRGVRPSQSELDAVQADDTALEGLIDGWLSSEEFGATIRDMHGEQLKIRSDLHELLPPVGTLSDLNDGDIHRAVSEGPLKLVEDVVLSGAPYTDIVTSPTLRVNAVGARVWGAEFDPASDEWQAWDPQDGRPEWGILADGAIWKRHISNGNNYQRARANLISDTLLCENFLTRDIPLGDDIDLSDDLAVADAVNNDPACSSCHQSLDPLGSFLWGFIPTMERRDVALDNEEGCQPLSELDIVVPENGNAQRRAVGAASKCYPIEPWIGDIETTAPGMNTLRDSWVGLQLRPPGYFGLGTDQDGLGQYIADDPRFTSCTVKRFYSYLTQTDPELMPLTTQDALLAVFEDSGLDARELAKAIVLSDPFTATELDDGRDIVGLQVTRPEQYARTVLDLTGFQWETDVDAFDQAQQNACLIDGRCAGSADLALTDLFGFRTMAGGMDGFRVTRPIHQPTPNRILTASKLAAEAAGFAVDHNFASVFSIDTTTTDEAVVRDEIARLHGRVLGEIVAADSEEVDETHALFTAVLDNGGDAPRAWKLVLAAMLQDTTMMFY